MPMNSESRCELLARPAQDRLRYFRDYIVAHPVLKDARARLLQIMREPSDGLLVFVLGPSGVGKTTLR
jgi:ABC-type nitrate/sulfonate/bicarbonate transport system ATPase subunit